MRVAIITELFHPHIGGQEFRYLRLSNLLLKYGFKVNVFTIDHIGTLNVFEKLNNIKVVRYIKIPNYTETIDCYVACLILLILDHQRELSNIVGT